MAIEKRQHIVDKYKLVSTKIEELSHGSFILVGGGLFDLYCDRLIRNNKNSSIYKFRRIETTEYPKFILSYFVHEMSMNKYPELYFMYKNANDIIEEERDFFSTDDWNFSARISVHMGLCLFFFNIDILKQSISNFREKLKKKINYECIFHEKKSDYIRGLKNQLSTFSEQESITSCISYIDSLYDSFNKQQREKIEKYQSLLSAYNKSPKNFSDYIKFLLLESWYSFDFQKDIKIDFDESNKILIVDYLLPSKEDIPNNRLTPKSHTWTTFSESKFNAIYDEIVYSIVIRTLAEIVYYDKDDIIDNICMNGIIRRHNHATGHLEDNVLLSIMVSKNQIADLDLEFINPKNCFRHLKGVSASKLHECVAITPILTSKLHDRRIINSRDVDVSCIDNLAEMDWEDFEHLVRQIFEWEFSNSESEVKVTQSSRDGGVDAIVFNPDPIRGGKIIIQAKRYTNTVPVTAVRDLYGTTINEGANKGILITTSDYGADSYKFAQGKNLTLLNGGHILYLLNKHGKQAYIDIKEAKRKQKEL